MTRACLAGVVILLLGALFGVVLSYNLLFWLAFLLNSFVFASLAVGLAMHVKSHANRYVATQSERSAPPLKNKRKSGLFFSGNGGFLNQGEMSAMCYMNRDRAVHPDP